MPDDADITEYAITPPHWEYNIRVIDNIIFIFTRISFSKLKGHTEYWQIIRVITLRFEVIDYWLIRSPGYWTIDYRISVNGHEYCISE